MQLKPFSFDRVLRAMETSRDRLLRIANALEGANIPYAVIGGNAVAAWVGRVDESMARFTPDIDLLVRRADLAAVENAMVREGICYSATNGFELWLFAAPPNHTRIPGDAIRVLFAGEKIKPHSAVSNPDVSESEHTGEFQIASLEAIVRLKLNSHRDKDRSQLRDLVAVGLLDDSWLPALPGELSVRLRSLLDHPLD